MIFGGFILGVSGRGGTPKLFKGICLLNIYQRWSSRGLPWPRGRPRGHILKSLASKPQVLKNCPVLGSRTALFLNRSNFVEKRQKPCGKSAKTFFLVSSSRDRLKKIFKDVFRLKKFFGDLFFEIA